MTGFLCSHKRKNEFTWISFFFFLFYRYIEIVKEEGLEISQPALDPDSTEIHHRITVRARTKKVHRWLFVWSYWYMFLLINFKLSLSFIHAEESMNSEAILGVQSQVKGLHALGKFLWTWLCWFFLEMFFLILIRVVLSSFFLLWRYHRRLNLSSQCIEKGT